MPKELEALKYLLEGYKLFKDTYSQFTPTREEVYEAVEEIEYVLQRLKAIDEADPSEALECLKSLDIQVRFMGILDVPSWEKYLPTIKQALQKAQSLENENAEYKRVIEVIKGKHYDDYVLTFETYESYQENANRVYEGELVIDWSNKKQLLELNLYTQEEFDLLKRWIK